MKQMIHHVKSNRQATWGHKPDSTRLRVLGVNVAHAEKKHTRPRRLVWTTVVNHGKVYPYDSMKRNGNGLYDRSLEKVI